MTPRPYAFIALTFALAIPFWVAGFLVDTSALPIDLPISALQAVCPLIAAAILSRGKVFRGSFRFSGPKGWYLFAFLFMPVVAAVTYAFSSIGRDLPGLDIKPVSWLVMAAVFFISAYTEEIGWTGYASGPLTDRHGTLGAGLILGVAWAAFHVVPWLFQTDHTPMWTVGMALSSIATRVIMSRVYLATGTVMAAVVLHDMINVAEFTYPVNGTYFDPMIGGLITAVIAAMMPLIQRPRRYANTASTLR